MFNIIDRANHMLKSAPVSVTEILYEFTARYKVGKNNLPGSDDLLAFTGDASGVDEITVSITDESSTIHVGAISWIEGYESFVDRLYDNDEITVTVKVEKKIRDGVLNVYGLEPFSEFLSNRTYIQLLDIFAELFKATGDKIIFRLLDTNGSLRTKNIVFTDNEDFEWTVRVSRSDQLKNCEDASVFLDRAKYPLIPQDFMIVGPIEGGSFQAIKDTFDKLRRILSYVYLSNSAYIVDDKVLLQFDPSSATEEYSFDELTENEIVSKIYDWAFKDDSCVDKASIARKIINVYCRAKQAILDIDEKIFNSIRSDYVIYQKNHADQYIDMKNKISECIVENAKQLQDLSHDVAEAFRNNFVAVIVFILTVLLTDSIDFSQFVGKEVSPNVTAVCSVFVIGSILYLIATVWMGNLKWKWIDESYKSLKKNYEGTLDKQDVEEAFSHDEPIKMAKQQFKGFRFRMICLWAVMVIGMAGFTWILYRNHEVPVAPANVVVETADPTTAVTPELTSEPEPMPTEVIKTAEPEVTANVGE